MRVAGVLFGEGEEHESIENAFRYAVYRINHDKDLLKDVRLAYDFQHVPSNDSFLASRKGKRLSCCLSAPASPLTPLSVDGIYLYINTLCTPFTLSCGISVVVLKDFFLSSILHSPSYYSPFLCPFFTSYLFLYLSILPLLDIAFSIFFTSLHSVFLSSLFLSFEFFPSLF